MSNNIKTENFTLCLIKSNKQLGYVNITRSNIILNKFK